MRIFITAVVLASSMSVASAQQAPPAAPTQPPATAPPVSTPPVPARPGQRPSGVTPTPTPPGGQVPSQPPPTAPAPQGGQLPAQAPPTQPPPARPGIVPPSGPPQGSVWQNLKIDVKIADSQTKISDAQASEISTSKTVSLYCADGRKGQVRSTSDQGSINVDVQPAIRPDGKIHLMLTVEYRPSNIVTFSESLDVMISDGRPLVLSQSVDPRSDRKVTVEVTATIVK